MSAPGQTYGLRQALDEGSPWFVAAYLELADGGSLGYSEITAARVKVYDTQSISEDVAVWDSGIIAREASNANGLPIWLDAPAFDGYAPTPRGRTMLLQLDPANWDAQGGRSYQAQLTASLDTQAGGGLVTLRAYANIRPTLT